ncbi:MAG: 23S rRNA (pseudouridine(1915)-N(3))-methyltransferase RlmH [Gammaproteobacteria bacterium]|nr:23S rRNA (pseudouridine(1915)-N(3))-methyltransferase RlmH [Gammaproteobacteria bacterium]
MRIRLLAVGAKPPRWAEAAFREYSRRLPAALKLEAPLIGLSRGHEQDRRRAREEEGQRLLGRIGRGDRVVALDGQGEAWSTEEWARRLAGWQAAGDDLSLLVGGPDGLAPSCLERADLRWSISALTLPHALVRVLVAEQLYRAVSLNANHPYHRA